METTKEQVIRLFLAFLSRHVPLGQAQLATLGGHGLEAKLWHELGIPSKHGWLIERNRERGGKLITNHRYNVHNQLATFGQILAGHGADRAFVDGFHLDLCGTFCNHAISDFESVVPLVLASSGRCLAITVADARRNLVLEQWTDFQERAKWLFGKREAEQIYKRLAAYQQRVPVKKNQPAFIKPFDPVKATQREFGLLVEFTELLGKQKLPWTAVVVERYIYVSRYLRRPFRMRTYFFRFGEKKAAHSSELAFAHAWINSTLSFANGEAFHEIETPPVVGTTVQPATKGVIIMTASKLSELARVLGGAEETEYNQLLADSHQLHSILLAIEGAKTGRVTESKPVAPSNEAPSNHPAPEIPHARQARKIKKTWSDFTDVEQIEFQLKALEAREAQDGHWQNGSWEKLLKQDFGYYSEALGRSCRAALARTSGTFRPMFERRIQAIFGDQAKPNLDRLAKIK